MRRKGMAILLTMAVAFGMTSCNKSNDEDIKKYGVGVDSAFETEDMQLETSVMAVGEEEVSLNEMLFYVYCLESNYDGDLTANIWDYEYSDDETIGSYTKEHLVKEIAQIKIICQQAAKEHVSLTEQELNEASVAAGQFMEALPKGNEDYNLTREMIRDIYAEHALAKKMYDVVAGTVDTSIPAEEAKQVTVSYIEVLTKGTDRNGNEVDLSEEQKKTALKRAKNLQKDVSTVEDFETYAKRNSDVDTTEMKINSATEPTELQVAINLNQGEISPVIETENGYYICYCKEEYNVKNAKEYKESIIKEREKQAFTEKFQEWKENYKVVASETLLDELKLH